MNNYADQLSYADAWDGFCAGMVSATQIIERVKRDELFAHWCKRKVRETRKRIEEANEESTAGRVMGRPPVYTAEDKEAILERIANGESLNALAKEIGFSPVTVYRWIEADEDFRNKYVRARSAQAETYADQIVAIADTATDPNVARLQIDARKWVAAKLLPKKYGDKVQTEVTGADGGPVQVESNPLDLARRVAFILNAGLAKKD